jgi:branched-chain amino acid transport system permease protein
MAAAAIDVLLSGQLLFAAAVAGALYALVAIGLNLVYGTMRLLNVAHGDVVMIGAYATYWAFASIGLSPLVGLLLAAAAAAAFGAALYLGLFRRLVAARRTARRLEANSLLLFFGISVIVQNLAAHAFSATPRGYQFLDTVLRVGNVFITGNRLVALAVALAACAGIWLFLRFHVVGLAMKALIQNRDAAAVVGVDTDRVQLLAFILGFALAAVAGCLVSMTEQISPFMGFPFTIAAFIVVILGGLGNLTGGIIAGFILGAIETYGVALTSPSLRSILLYAVFVGILVLRPQGLLGGARIFR